MNIINSATYVICAGLEAQKEFYQYAFHSLVSMSDDINAIIKTAQKFKKDITLEELFPIIKEHATDKYTNFNNDPNYGYYAFVDSMNIVNYKRGDIYKKGKIDEEIVKSFEMTFKELEVSKEFISKGEAQLLLITILLAPRGKPMLIFYNGNTRYPPFDSNDEDD